MGVHRLYDIRSLAATAEHSPAGNQQNGNNVDVGDLSVCFTHSLSGEIYWNLCL